MFDYTDQILTVFLTVTNCSPEQTSLHMLKEEKFTWSDYFCIFLVSALSLGIIKKRHQETKLRKKT